MYFTCKQGIHPTVYLKDSHMLYILSNIWSLFLTAHPLGNPTYCRSDVSMKSLSALYRFYPGHHRTVLLQLYCTLIHSKINCGSFIYSSAYKFELSILNTIHSARIQLAPGAFHTSSFTNTDAESGKPSLHFQRDLLLCSYAAKLVAHPCHPSCSAIFSPILCYRSR